MIENQLYLEEDGTLLKFEKINCLNKKNKTFIKKYINNILIYEYEYTNDHLDKVIDYTNPIIKLCLFENNIMHRFYYYTSINIKKIYNYHYKSSNQIYSVDTIIEGIMIKEPMFSRC